MLMQQALGADKLPSYNQRPFPAHARPASGTATNVTQAQASRELAGLNNAIVTKDALLKSAGNTGDAGTYLTAAKNYYRTAYTAYQAGKYNDAHAAAAVGRELLEVVGHLVRAATAPNNPDTPVPVPAPNI